MKQYQRIGLIFTATFFLALPASADTLFGVYAGAGTWRQELNGEIATGPINIDVEDDLALDDELNNVMYLAIEHPLPFVPNIRLNYTDLSLSGDSVLSRPIEFNNIVFNLSEAIATDVDVTQIDLVLYYELLDNVVSLDVGVAARWIDGEFSLMSLNQTARAQFDVVIPTAYVKVRADLPFSGFWIGAEMQASGYKGNDLMDANAQIGWESPLRLGAELGWRTFDVEFSDLGDIAEAGLDISGPYFAFNFHF